MWYGLYKYKSRIDKSRITIVIVYSKDKGQTWYYLGSYPSISLNSFDSLTDDRDPIPIKVNLKDISVLYKD